VNNDLTNSIYLSALTSTEGIGAKTALRIAGDYPNWASLTSAPGDELQNRFGEQLARSLLAKVLKNSAEKWRSAETAVLKHTEQGIQPVSLLDNSYPKLLRLIPDPPAILYVRGNTKVLDSLKSVAVVGTRDATSLGCAVAARVAGWFARSGFVVVSGLAKGIDAAAHKGCVDTRGITVAVLTDIQNIYPSENRPLAMDILNSGGALVSEMPLGQRTHRSAFVQRDRIQSGMSVAVVPVQTDTEGGTMHTVRFAEAQNRLVFCPRPLDKESHLSQYAGIHMLLRSKRALEFEAKDYETVLKRLAEHSELLTGIPSTVAEMPKLTPEDDWTLTPPEPLVSEKKSKAHPEIAATALEVLERSFRDVGLAEDKGLFNAAITTLRARLFSRRKRASHGDT
jgi:DNA processing protein